MTKKQYALGFVFSQNQAKVLLIQKTHPYFQAGKLNGLGGKCEPNETPLQCMVREMEEESGVQIAQELWQQATEFSGDDWHVTVFCHTWSGNQKDFQSKTEEIVGWYKAASLPPNAMENLAELISQCKKVLL